MAIPTNPFARYRASQLALNNNDPVSTWTDEGSGGNDLTQTGTARPTFEAAGFNGNASVLFDGTEDFMQTAAYAAALSQPNTIVIMGEMVALDTNERLLYDGVGSTQRHITLWSGDEDPQIFAMFAGGAVIDSTRVPIAGEDACIASIFDGSGSEFHYNKNGNELGDPSIIGTQDLGGLTLMARFNGFDTQLGANMRLVEVLIYDRALNSTELTDLQD